MISIHSGINTSNISATKYRLNIQFYQQGASTGAKGGFKMTKGQRDTKPEGILAHRGHQAKGLSTRGVQGQRVLIKNLRQRDKSRGTIAKGLPNEMGIHGSLAQRGIHWDTILKGPQRGQLKGGSMSVLAKWG